MTLYGMRMKMEAKRLQRLKKKRQRAEGLAEMRKKQQKEMGRISKATGTGKTKRKKSGWQKTLKKVAKRAATYEPPPMRLGGGFGRV